MMRSRRPRISDAPKFVPRGTCRGARPGPFTPAVRREEKQTRQGRGSAQPLLTARVSAPLRCPAGRTECPKGQGALAPHLFPCDERSKPSHSPRFVRLSAAARQRKQRGVLRAGVLLPGVRSSARWTTAHDEARVESHGNLVREHQRGPQQEPLPQGRAERRESCAPGAQSPCWTRQRSCTTRAGGAARRRRPDRTATSR